MNTHVFRSDSSIILKEHQKTKLLPILAAKISKLDSLKMMNLEDEERRKRRKAIRKQWHPKIDAVLDSNQVKMRHYYLKL